MMVGPTLKNLISLKSNEIASTHLFFQFQIRSLPFHSKDPPWSKAHSNKELSVTAVRLTQS